MLARTAAAHGASAIRLTRAHMGAQISRRIATALSMTARLAAAGALRCWTAYIRTMHESRRREAALLLAQYCPELDPSEFMRSEYGVGEAERRRRDGPLSEAEIAFLRDHSKSTD